MSKLKELQQQKAELEKQINAEAKVHFKEESDRLFEQFPIIEEFSWRQYTPHFCDGDPCTFSVHSDDVKINGIGRWDDDSDKVPKEIFEAVSDFIGGIDEDAMLDMFEDGNEITMKRGKKEATVEYYEHD